MLAGTTATGLKTDLLVRSILATAAGLGATRLAVTASRGSSRLRLRLPAPPLGACVIALFVVALALGQQALDIPYVKEQRRSTVPSTELEDFDQATRGGPDDPVLLTDLVDLPVFRDVYVFNVWRAHFAHPAAEFSERTDFLTALSREDDPEVFTLALTHNRFDEIDYVVLRPAADGTLLYLFADDDFPRGTKDRELRFDLDLFEPEVFERTDTGSFVSLRVREDPLDGLESCDTGDQSEECRTLAAAVRRYRPYLDDDTLAALDR